MALAVSDTGPLNYLVLIGEVSWVPSLFAKVFVPARVFDELSDVGSPKAVRSWISDPPAWLEIRAVDEDSALAMPSSLDLGERDAISLARSAGSDILFMDDREGARAARRLGLAVTGTLGLIDLASRKGLLDLATCIERLKATSFYYRESLFASLLAQYEARKR